MLRPLYLLEVTSQIQNRDLDRAHLSGKVCSNKSHGHIVWPRLITLYSCSNQARNHCGTEP
jgi:hypothetical protein